MWKYSFHCIDYSVLNTSPEYHYLFSVACNQSVLVYSAYRLVQKPLWPSLNTTACMNVDGFHALDAVTYNNETEANPDSSSARTIENIHYYV